MHVACVAFYNCFSTSKCTVQKNKRAKQNTYARMYVCCIL